MNFVKVLIQFNWVSTLVIHFLFLVIEIMVDYGRLAGLLSGITGQTF